MIIVVIMISCCCHSSGSTGEVVVSAIRVESVVDSFNIRSFDDDNSISNCH